MALITFVALFTAELSPVMLQAHHHHSLAYTTPQNWLFIPSDVCEAAYNHLMVEVFAGDTKGPA